MKTTRILVVTSDEDYGVHIFEKYHKGALVKDILDNPLNFLPTQGQKENDEDWFFEIKEFPYSFGKDLVAFFRDKADSDHLQDTCFFHEDETINDV